MNENKSYTFDAETVLKAAGAITASADGTILDIGSGFYDADLVIDVTALDAGTGDEKYTVSVEASNTADMSAGSVALATKVFGLLTVPMDADLVALDRYVVPFRNEQNGVNFRYIRLSTIVAGTTPSIDFSAFVGKR